MSGRFARTLLSTLGLIVALGLSGCAAAGFEAAYVIQDEQAYVENIAAARSGDPAAQYAVGSARCCSIGERSDIYYDTRAATSWLCAAAAQGHGPAMHKLGLIYAAASLEPWRFVRRGLIALEDPPQNRALAYVWFEKARVHGAPEAAVHAADVRNRLTAREALIAAALLEIEGDVPCLWDEVMNPEYLRIFKASTRLPG